MQLIFVLATMLAHNLNREMQMMAGTQQRNTTQRQAPLWQLQQLGTLRRKLIQRRAFDQTTGGIDPDDE